MLEVLIVIVIMIGFMAVSVPMFNKFTESAKLDTAARSISSTLIAARGFAITNNRPFYVMFVDSTGGSYGQYFISENQIDPMEKKESLPAGIEFSVTPFVDGEISFTALGQAGEGGSVVVKDMGAGTKTVTVIQTTGAVKID